MHEDGELAQLTDAQRIERLEAAVRTLSAQLRELKSMARSVETMEKKWARKEASDRSISARFGRR